AIHDVKFVKEWKLDRDVRQFVLCVARAGRGHEISITPEIDDLFETISAVDGERPENREIDDQDDPVEGVELVERADIAPGFIDEIVEVLLKDRLWRRSDRAGPR